MRSQDSVMNINIKKSAVFLHLGANFKEKPTGWELQIEEAHFLSKHKNSVLEILFF